MTGKYPDLFRSAVLWWPGTSEVTDGFPILPSGVTVSSVGSFGTDLNLGTNKTLKTFLTGSSRHIQLTDDDAWLYYNGDFTICGWVYNTYGSFTSTIYPTLLCQSNITTAYCECFVYSTGLALLGGGNPVFDYLGVCSPAFNTWQHFTAIRSGSSCLMYLNGAPLSVTVNTAWTNTSANIAGNVWMGGDTGGGTMKGNLKDVMLWKGRALTVPEIKLLMRKTHPTTGTGLIPGPYSYWRSV